MRSWHLLADRVEKTQLRSSRPLLLLGLLMLVCASGCSAKPDNPPVEKRQEMRSEVKHYLDELAGDSIESIVQTTDSMAEPKRVWRPNTPAPFPAGRYKAVFVGQGRAHAILAQTEEKLPHFSTVRPGIDVIGGFVQLFIDPRSETPEGPVLSANELDYLIRIIYRKGCAPLDVQEARAFDMLKDRLLAIRFNGKPGMIAYHNQLLGLIDNRSLCRP